MATKKSSSSSRSKSRKKGQSAEPAAARAAQLVILVIAVTLLFGALFQKLWPVLLLVGVLALGSAFPPARRHVDRWMVGKARGEEADQAAVIRMALGIALVVLAFVILL